MWAAADMRQSWIDGDTTYLIAGVWPMEGLTVRWKISM